MKANRLAAAVTAALLTGSLLACGGAGSQLADSAEAGNATDPLLVGLPGLEDLPLPTHGISALPPYGFLALDPVSPIATSNASDGGGYLVLDNAINVLTYALYGVYGFDGDNYPVSLKVNVGSGGGLFYLAFSDYATGKWQIAGPYNADGEFGIPLVEEHTDQNAYVSPRSYHYFALIVPDGQLVNLDGVELGVSGGDIAPDPVIQFFGQGGANGMYLNWLESSSYQDPDFAGYIVERAPQFGGAYTELAEAPALATHFHDSTAVLDTMYRYRIAAYDTSGNQALSSSMTFGPATGDEAGPVVVAQLPKGPLYGPVDVTINLADSFDPEGEGITSFEISYISTTQRLFFPGPMTTLSLEPGCYFIFCGVECADGRSSSEIKMLKVYPQWNADSHLVRTPQSTGIWKSPRLYLYRGGKQPSDGRITLAGFDVTMAGLAFYHYDGAGGFTQAMSPQIEWISDIGEPVVVDENLVFPVCTPYGFLTAAYDGTAVTLGSIAEVTNSYGVAMARDNAGRSWIAYGFDNGINTKVRLDGSLFGFGTVDIGTATAATHQIDLAVEPASGHVFAFYGDGVTVDYAEYDPDADLPIGSGPLFAGMGLSIDAEVNPENNRLVVMFHVAGSTYTREQDGIGGWTPPVQIDNSLPNNSPADLAPNDAGRLNAYFSLNNGQAHRYEYSAGIWSPVNTSSFSADSGYDSCLLPIGGSPDMSAVDLCNDGVIRLARMNDDGSDNVFASIDSTIGQGRDMHAAAGLDGLHLLWSEVYGLSTTRHCISASGPDEGAVWADAADFTASSGLNLVATPPGDIYATGYMGGAATLYYWDPMGPNWLNDAAFPAQNEHRPLLGSSNPLHDPPVADVVFGVWDDGATIYHITSDQHGGAWADSPFLPYYYPVWDSIYADYLFSERLIFTAGPDADTPVLGFFDSLLDEEGVFAATMLDAQNSPYDKPSVLGRTSGAAQSLSGFATLDQFINVSVFSQGTFGHPMRFTQRIAGATDSFEYPLGTFSELADPRTTVSVSSANSLTVVNLLSSLDGTESYFEWSNFGDWEQLELPGGLENMSQPLIVVGRDGRWHLVYRNWKTDEILCRSTL